MNKEIWEKPEIISHSTVIYRSYTFWTGNELFDGLTNESDLSRKLYHAPFVVVSHGTEEDPVFNYANLKAQEIWNMGWDEFTSMPSRFSAEPIEESKRNQLLETGRKKGITRLKQGIRINKDGRRFYIKDVVLFNLLNKNQDYCGQGAVYPKWEFI